MGLNQFFDNFGHLHPYVSYAAGALALVAYGLGCYAYGRFHRRLDKMATKPAAVGNYVPVKQITDPAPVRRSLVDALGADSEEHSLVEGKVRFCLPFLDGGVGAIVDNSGLVQFYFSGETMDCEEARRRALGFLSISSRNHNPVTMEVRSDADMFAVYRIRGKIGGEPFEVSCG